MLPPRHSPAGVVLAAANIAQYRAGLRNIPLAIETPVSYLPPLPGELPDGEFVAAVAEAADCGILLDLHNVLCNARNGRQSVAAFLDAVPLDRVWEIHLAGGESEAGFWLDSHSGLAEGELVEIAAALIPRLPRLRAMIFEIMPERVPEVGLAGIARQLGTLRDLWETRASACRPRTRRVSGAPAAASPLDPESWASLLGAAVTGRASAAGCGGRCRVVGFMRTCARTLSRHDRRGAGKRGGDGGAAGYPSAAAGARRSRHPPSARRVLARSAAGLHDGR